MNEWPMVPLGEVLQLDLSPESVHANGTYPIVGIYGFGRGLFTREAVSGGSISATQLFRVKANQFIYSRLKAFEGAFGVVPEELDGRFVSNEFPTFSSDPKRLLPEFLGWYFRNPTAWKAAAHSSTGIGARRERLKPEQLLRMKITLPPLAEQQRLVERLNALSAKIDEAKRLREDATLEQRFLSNAWVRNLFSEPGTSRVGEFVRFQTGYAFKSEWFVSQGIRLARNVNVGHGTLNWEDLVCLPVSQSDDFARFALTTGDILISLDRPIISTGVKVARVTTSDLPALLLQRVARAEFIATSLDPEFFFLWLTSPRFTEAIDPGRSNGVPHISHKDIERISFSPPSIAEQRRVVELANQMAFKRDEATSLATVQQLELNAMLPAILDQAFNAHEQGEEA